MLYDRIFVLIGRALDICFTQNTVKLFGDLRWGISNLCLPGGHLRTVYVQNSLCIIIYLFHLDREHGHLVFHDYS